MTGVQTCALPICFTILDLGASPGSPQIDQAELVDGPATTGRAIAETAARYGAKLHELFLVSIALGDGSVPRPAAIGDADTRRALAERLRPICGGALEAGFASIMLGTGGTVEGQAHDEAMRNAADTLNELYDVARASGIALHVEPAAGSVIDTVERVRRFIHLCPSLRITLDYAHFTGAGTKLEEIYPLHELAGHIHLKPATYREYKVAFRRNEIDFAAVVRRLVADGWDGVASAETIYEVGSTDFDTNPVAQGVLVLEAARAGLDRDRDDLRYP